jgi:hypothetical protein
LLNPFEKIGALVKGLWADRPPAVDPALALRLKQAYDQLPPPKRQVVSKHFDRAHQRMLMIKDQQIPAYDPDAAAKIVH